jgi:hypothetical protein
MTLYECKICGNQFISIQNMYKHQRTAKYCIEIGKKICSLTCIKCQNIFYNEREYTLHNENCIGQCDQLQIKIDNLNIQLMQLQTDLQQKNDEILQLKTELQTTKEYTEKFVDITKASATKPTTNTTNNVNNKFVLKNCVSNERIKESMSSLTIEDFKDGPVGLSNWAHKNFLYDSAMCTDVSRKKIMWKDDNDTIIKDYRGYKLCKKIFKAIHKDNYKLITKYIKKTTDYLENECKDPIERERMYNMIIKLHSIKSECSEASQGIINDFANKFIKNLIFVLADDENEKLMIDNSDSDNSDSSDSSDSDESQKIVFKKGPKMFTNPH